MKYLSLVAIAAATLSGSAFAADLPSTKGVAAAPVVTSPWDFDVGAGLTSDYIFRGITQSNHQPGVAGHGELRYNYSDTYQFYVGVSGESIKLSPYTPSPSMELDGDAGVRATFGAFSYDLGAIVYGYPNTPFAYHPRKDATWEEVYIKPSYTVNDALTIGGNFFYTPSYINTGADGEYLSGTVKYTLPGALSAFAVSGEVGYQWLGKADAFVVPGFVPSRNLPSYATWNGGVAYSYKFVTLDLRYYGTNLSRANAFALTGQGNTNGGAGSNYGDDRFVATLSFDLTSKDLK